MPYLVGPDWPYSSRYSSVVAVGKLRPRCKKLARVDEVANKLAAITRFSATVYKHGMRSAGYWLTTGINGRGRPIMPSRFGRGPYNNASRYALDLALYPILAMAWLVGVACRSIWRRVQRSTDGTKTVVVQWDNVRLLPLLSPDECDRIADRVQQLRNHWRLHQPGFYTLGYAAYMDCRDPASRLRYFDDAPRLNSVLVDHFWPLYRSVLATLEEALGERCRLAEGQAIPGFHVWLGRGIPRRGFDAGSVHFDLQYLDNGLCADRWLTTSNVVSFTLPVRLPKAGGGLNIWDVHHPQPAGREVWPFSQMERLHYERGFLVLHSGHELHQIAPIERVTDNDERICMQGHGIRQDGCWLLYW